MIESDSCENEEAEFVQTTIDGEETDAERERPSTLLWCPETEQWVLRSLQLEWPYELFESREDAQEELYGVELDPKDEDDKEVVEVVGGLYDIEISYSVNFSFRIPAYSESEATERASDLVDYPNNCSDMHQVHSNHSEVDEIFADDPKLPNDWDPYGSDPLWEVYGNGE